MANTLTNLISDAFAALDVVSRELVGYIPSVTRDASVDRVAIGQSVRSPITRANTAGRNITAAMALPAANDQTVDNAPIAISKSRAFPFSWTGEERYTLDRGAGSLTISQGWIAQALRAAVNEVESDLATAAYQGASRAFGAAGTTPFATNLGESAQLKKILDDNGAPGTNRSLVINTSAGASLRTLLNNPLNANTSLNGDSTRQGMILDVNGFMFRESAQVPTVTAGTGASYLLNGALAIGATTVTVDTGTGTILAGDIVTIGNNKYVVATALSGGSFTIAAPGIIAAAADNLAITVNATSARSTAFSDNAIVLVSRLPEVDPEGDLAILRETISDPVSGLSFEIAAYPGYRMITYEVSLAWGVKVIKPEHLAVLLG